MSIYDGRSIHTDVLRQQIHPTKHTSTTRITPKDDIHDTVTFHHICDNWYGSPSHNTSFLVFSPYLAFSSLKPVLSVTGHITTNTSHKARPQLPQYHHKMIFTILWLVTMSVASKPAFSDSWRGITSNARACEGPQCIILSICFRRVRIATLYHSHW